MVNLKNPLGGLASRRKVTRRPGVSMDGISRVDHGVEAREDEKPAVSISTLSRGEDSTLKQTQRDSREASTLLSVTDLGLKVVSEHLSSMRSLSEQGLQEELGQRERHELQNNLDATLLALDELSAATEYAGHRPLRGGLQATFMVAQSPPGYLDIELAQAYSSEALFERPLSVSSAADAKSSLGALNQAEELVSRGQQQLSQLLARFEDVRKGVSSPDPAASRPIHTIERAEQVVERIRVQASQEPKEVLSTQAQVNHERALMLVKG